MYIIKKMGILKFLDKFLKLMDLIVSEILFF